MSHCCDHQHPNPTTPAPSGDSNPRPAGARLSRFRIEQMDCPTEQGLIETRLGKLRKQRFPLVGHRGEEIDLSGERCPPLA